MADKFPSTFVDRKTGSISKFRTLRDRIQDDVLPNAAHFGLLAAKVSLLAPFIGGLAVAAPVTAALWWGTRWVMKKSLDVNHDRLMQEHRKGEYSEYDLTVPADKAAFERRFTQLHPHFADDYLKMAKLAKMEQVPKLLIIEPYFEKQGRSRFAGMISDFMAAATARPNGKDPVVMLGRGALHDLTQDEMRAVIGHEFTHVKLGHMKETANWLGRFSLNGVINTALVAAGLLGGLPLLPVLGLIAVTNAVGIGLKSIQSRRHEELCDRGAALLTGGTKDLSAALDKIKNAMLKIRQLEVDAEFRSRGLDPPEVKEAGGLKQFINGTHPSNEKRAKRLDAFETKHHAYCEKQRSLFAAAFAAALPPVNNTSPPPVSNAPANPAPPVSGTPQPPAAKPVDSPAAKPIDPPAAKPGDAPAAKPAPKPKPPKIIYLKSPKWGFGY